jgi:hypothetical protein
VPLIVTQQFVSQSTSAVQRGLHAKAPVSSCVVQVRPSQQWRAPPQGSFSSEHAQAPPVMQNPVAPFSNGMQQPPGQSSSVAQLGRHPANSVEVEATQINGSQHRGPGDRHSPPSSTQTKGQSDSAAHKPTPSASSWTQQ